MTNPGTTGRWPGFAAPLVAMLLTIGLKGGGLKKIGRHGTAALLNALHPLLRQPRLRPPNRPSP